MSWSASLTLADVPAWIAPGRETVLTATIVNHGAAPDEFQLSVRGIDPAWVTFRPPLLRLAPGEAGAAAIIFSPPGTAAVIDPEPVVRLLSRRAGAVIAEVSTAGTIPSPEPPQAATAPQPIVPVADTAGGSRLPVILGGAALVALLCVAIGVGGYILARGGRASTPTTTPSAVPIAAPEPTATELPPTATAPRAAASARASATATGQAFVVGNTGGDGVFLRRTPNFEDRDPPALVDGTRLMQIGPDVSAAGTTYHHVRAPDGRTGYVPAQFTLPAP